MSLTRLVATTTAASAVALLLACGGSKLVLDRGQQRFDDAAAWTKVFDAKDRDEWQRPAAVITLLSLRPGMIVADVGAGTGYFEPHLARAVGQTGKVLALDIEPNLVAFMRDRFVREHLENARASLCLPDDPLLGEASVDRIVLVDTWHHVPDRVLYAQRLSKAVRVGGAIFVVDFTLESKMGPPPEHRLSADVVRAELAGAGLDATILGESLPEQYVVVGWRSH